MSDGTAPVTVLDYQAGNTRSVVRALEHEGGDVTVTDDPAVAQRAERLVLPGQGHFGQCMRRLEESGLGDAVREVVGGGRPFLGVCVGMQLLFEGSDEAETPGFGFLQGHVHRIRTDRPLPHVGWNSVTFTERGRRDPLLSDVADEAAHHFYHVHSYAVSELPAEETLGECEYDQRFASIVGRDNVRAVQFHPEKSQEAGLRILRNFLSL